MKRTKPIDYLRRMETWDLILTALTFIVLLFVVALLIASIVGHPG